MTRLSVQTTSTAPQTLWSPDLTTTRPLATTSLVAVATAVPTTSTGAREREIIWNDTPMTEGLGRRPRAHVRVTFAEGQGHDPAARGTEGVSPLFQFLSFQVPRDPRPLQGPLPVDSHSRR